MVIHFDFGQTLTLNCQGPKFSQGKWSDCFEKKANGKLGIRFGHQVWFWLRHWPWRSAVQFSISLGKRSNCQETKNKHTIWTLGERSHPFSPDTFLAFMYSHCLRLSLHMWRRDGIQFGNHHAISRRSQSKGKQWNSRKFVSRVRGNHQCQCQSRASPALAISWELSSFRAVLSAACLNIDNLSLCEFISTLFIFYVRRFNQNQINHPEGSITINHSYALDLCLCCLRHIDIVHHTNRLSVLYQIT